MDEHPSVNRQERSSDEGQPGQPVPRWSIYMLRCRDGALYTGIATDVERRLVEHQQDQGKGAKYLRGRGPLRLEIRHEVDSRALALRVESHIKRLPKAAKEALVAGDDLLAALVVRVSKASPRRQT